MISLFEIAERSLKGPKLDEKEWNLGLYKKMKALIKDYKLEEKFEQDIILEIDHDYADRAFQAAISFLTEMGVYCITNNRIINFSEEEVKKALKEAPHEITVGEGKDTRTIDNKEIENKRPLNIIGGLHSPYSEELSGLIPKSFAQMPRSDIIEGFNTKTTDGWEIHSMPFEVYASKREAAWMRDGVRKAGRPGMAITFYPISTKAAALIAPIDPDYGLRRTDGILLSILPDIKVEHDLLTAAIVYEEYGSYKVNGGAPTYIGGFCGGPEGAIIESIVKKIAAWIIYRDCMHYVGVGELPYQVNEENSSQKHLTIRLWPDAVVHHALCRNSDIIRFGGVGIWEPINPGGLGSERWLWVLANYAIENTILGSNIAPVRIFRPRIDQGQTPFEVEFLVEVSDAIIKSRIRREEGAEMMRKIVDRIKRSPPEKGLTLRECYDLIKQKPKKEYEEKYQKVKKELTSLGLKFE